MSEGRPIKRFVQLIAIDNDCFLFSRKYLQQNLDISFNLGEFSANPLKDIYITNKKEVQSFIGHGRKQIIPFIQKINFIFIKKVKSNNPINCNGGSFPKKMYKEFIELKNKKELDKFIKKEHGFCIFPTKSEGVTLLNECKKVGIKKSPVYLASNVAIPKKILKKYTKTTNKARNKIRKINIDFIWKKQQQLKEFIKLYLSKNLKENKLLWFNEQLENVSETLTNQNNAVWKKEDGDKEINKDDRDLKEIIGEKSIKNTAPVVAYRIYGHYALCCLEFYLEIQDKSIFFTCKKCGQLNYKGEKSKEKFCSRKNNEECFKKRQAERKRKSYLRNKKANK